MAHVYYLIERIHGLSITDILTGTPNSWVPSWLFLSLHVCPPLSSPHPSVEGKGTAELEPHVGSKVEQQGGDGGSGVKKMN